ncbi:MAG: ATP synthase F1 subunit gamma [Bacteroidetes bacterium]|nr:ATP synthase F1 subunit gamma [Bacteroidota bacterium]
MGNLKEVRNRIVSVKSTQQITKAMKVVSAAKLRRAQQRITQMRPYALKLQELLGNLAGSVEGSPAAKYFSVRPVKNVLLIAVTSDRGLAGGYNSIIVKEVLNAVKNTYPGCKIDIITVGKKAKDGLRRFNYNIIEEHNTLFSNLTFEAADDIASRVMDKFIAGDYDAVDILYNRFKNAGIYLPTAERFLPVTKPAKDEKAKDFKHDYIFEPSQEAIVGKLVQQSLKISFFRTLLESNTAEHGARMTAMDKATDNAEDLLRALKLSYNKERQATITKEILEIVSGAQALG